MRLVAGLLLAALLPIAPFSAAQAAEPGWQRAGARMGISADAKRVFYHQYEAFAVYNLPWDWRASSGWGVATRIDGSAGLIHGAGEDAFIGAVGPELALNRPGFPLELEGGINVAFLSSPTFGTESLDGGVQFISHIGVNARLSKWFGVGYRFQHMSNGSLYGGSNPGINLHLLGLNVYLDH